MKILFVTPIVAVAALLAAPACAADRASMGAREYQKDCADCHGKGGKGDGLYSVNAKAPLPDLTTLAKRNGGSFPNARVERSIDGRLAIKAHGTSDMPAWGKEYLRRAGEYYGEVAYDPEAYVRERVTALVAHLERLQSK